MQLVRCGVVAYLVLLSAGACADEDARTYFDRATAQFALGKYNDAALNYERCFELKPDPAILYNAAQAHRLGGNKQRALELYQNYVKIYRSRVDNLAEVQRHIDQLRAAIAKDQQVSNQPPVTTKPAVVERAPAVTAPPPPNPAPVLVAPAPERRDQPLVKRPWFWGVVAGAAVVVIGTSIALGVVLGTPSPTNPKPSFGTVKAN